MLSKDNFANFEILAQYPIPLKHQHQLPGLGDFCLRKHYQWDLIPVSDWIQVEKNDKSLNYIDLAFCEYSEEQKIIEIKILRFQSEGQDHLNPTLYLVGTKLILS